MANRTTGVNANMMVEHVDAEWVKSLAESAEVLGAVARQVQTDMVGVPFSNDDAW